jgi:hypothetical protein
MTAPNDPASLWQWFATNAAAIQAIATVVLVGITAWYIHVTRSIAAAANRQADAAQQSTRLQFYQWEANEKMRAAALASAVHTALEDIRMWERYVGLAGVATRPGFGPMGFVPKNADDAVRFAGRSSPDLYIKVTSAFGRLRRAEILFGLTPSSHLGGVSSTLQQLLDELKENLKSAARVGRGRELAKRSSKGVTHATRIRLAVQLGCTEWFDCRATPGHQSGRANSEPEPGIGCNAWTPALCADRTARPRAGCRKRRQQSS